MTTLYRSKKDIDSFLRKLYKFLRNDHSIEIRKMRVRRGWIFTNRYPTTMRLDPRDQIISTLIHEVLHYIHPRASEKNILEMEKTIMTKMTERQTINVIKRFAASL